MTRVALADGQQLVREALATMLSIVPDIEVVGSYGTGESLLGALCATTPDVIVIETQLPDGSGLEWACRAKARRPDTRVLVLTSSHGDAELALALDMGVDGFFYKEASAEDLLRALRACGRDGFFASPGVARHMRDLASSAADHSLTRRETEVMLALGSGLTTNEIALELSISSSTVKSHLTLVYRKLGVRNRVEAVREARERGLLS